MLIFLAEITGYGHLLHHNSLVDDSIPLIVRLLVFLAMWQVMIVAMMLPSSVPMLKLFAKVNSTQPPALFLFICAYQRFGLDLRLHFLDWILGCINGIGCAKNPGFTLDLP